MTARATVLEGTVLQGTVLQGTVLHGTVADYDHAAGYGHVVDPDGARWWFHCTAIAGGTRVIDVGAPVSFDLVPGRLGRYEPSVIRPR